MSEGNHLEGCAPGVDRVLWLAPVDARVESAGHVIGWAVGFSFASRTIAVFISARWLNMGTQPGVAFTFASSAVLVMAALVQGFGPSARPMNWVWNVATFRWVVIFLAFSGCSLLWTSAAAPMNSALYWSALATDVLLVLLVIRGSDTQQAAHSIMKGFISGSCMLAAIAWVLPQGEDLRLGDLEYFNTNQIGNLCALGLFMCLILASRRQGTWRMASVFLAITLFRSLSKSTLVALVASQAYRLIVDRAMSRRSKVLLVVCTIAITLVFWGLIEAYMDVYSNAGSQAQTLTGRTAIWAWSLNAAWSRPWLGNGIDAMWKVAPPFGAELFEARHAENELLQQFFAYGVAGVVMLIGIYASLWRRFRRLIDVSERSVLISLLIFIVVRGVAEAEPFDLLLPLWMITTLALLVERSARGQAPRPVAAAPIAASDTQTTLLF